MADLTDLTPVVTSAIALAVAIITVFVIPLIRSKVSAERLTELYTYVKIGVLAAEQLAKEGIINKEERTERVIEFLNKNGFTVNLDEVEEMIKSIVLSLPPFVPKNQEDPEALPEQE